MTKLPRIAITGASGRMGQMLTLAVSESEKVMLGGLLERPGHAWIGRDIDGVKVTDDPEAVFAKADVVIDFTMPEVTVRHAQIAVQTGTALVIGTTGFNDDQITAVHQAAQTVPIVRAGNMSLGVNLLVNLTRKVAEALDTSFDIEIVEAHHNKKADAPSGTALMLGEAAAQGRGVVLSDVRDAGRDGITGPRKTGDIGFAVVRGGDIVGEHDVVFAGEGERIILRHIATDRAIFAKGALRAALWVTGKPAGVYSMTDVLGL